MQGLSVEDLKALLPRESLQELCVQAQCCSIISCSVLGSTLSQEIIKAITCVGKPGRGTFVFSSVDMVVRCIPMPPSS